MILDGDQSQPPLCQTVPRGLPTLRLRSRQRPTDPVVNRLADRRRSGGSRCQEMALRHSSIRSMAEYHDYDRRCILATYVSLSLQGHVLSTALVTSTSFQAYKMMWRTCCYEAPHAAGTRRYVPILARAKLVNFDRPKQVEIDAPVRLRPPGILKIAGR